MTETLGITLVIGTLALAFGWPAYMLLIRPRRDTWERDLKWHLNAIEAMGFIVALTPRPGAPEVPDHMRVWLRMDDNELAIETESSIHAPDAAKRPVLRIAGNRHHVGG